ncbi:MAG: phage tail protein [Rikenellaceae bacterium]
MEYLKLGELKLKMQEGVISFNEKIGYSYAKHEILEGKPVLQATGEELSEISLQVSLYAYLGDDIPAIMTQLDKMCFSGEPQKLIFANGVFKGDYCIISRDTTINRTDGIGNILSSTFSLSLLEYANRVLINTRNCERKSQSENSNRKVVVK